MTLHDGTPREPYEEARSVRGEKGRDPVAWRLVSTVVVLIVILLGLAAMRFSAPRVVTNAPATPPPSTQQPDPGAPAG